MSTVIQQLYERKSVRVFTEQPIDEASTQAILKAAAMAPTAGNQQLYTILNITDPALKKSLSESCDHQPFIADGKLVLVFCADCLKWYDAFLCAGCSPRKPGEGDLMLAVCDALIAAQNAVVAAESLGIGSCYIGDIMENVEIHQKTLQLPKYVFPVAMLVFGYPTQKQKNRKKPERVDMEYIVCENGYQPLSEDALRRMFAPRCGEKSYEDWMLAFCNRKYNSDFSREMTRSVRQYLKQFED